MELLRAKAFMISTSFFSAAPSEEIRWWGGMATPRRAATSSYSLSMRRSSRTGPRRRSRPRKTFWTAVAVGIRLVSWCTTATPA